MLAPWFYAGILAMFERMLRSMYANYYVEQTVPYPYILLRMYLLMNRGSSVGKVTDYGMENWGGFSAGPVQFSGLPHLHSNG
jgi:hypothetical protein